MLVGMAAYRSGFFTSAWSDERYRRIAWWGIGIGLAGHAALVIADLATGFYVPVVLGGFLAAMVPFRFAQAIGYAALIILWSRGGGRAAKRFAAVGRAAFSNYLGTSIICTPSFTVGASASTTDVSRVQAWLIVPVVAGY